MYLLRVTAMSFGTSLLAVSAAAAAAAVFLSSSSWSSSLMLSSNAFGQKSPSK